MRYTTRLYTIIFWTLSCASTFKGFSQPAGKPNVLFILVDDFGCDDLGYAGSKFYETPYIDALARKGTIFSRAYSAGSVCSPSRASIFTGVYPTVHGITDYLYAKAGKDWPSAERHTQLLPPNYVQFLPDTFTTLPEALKKNGYKTFFAGKWHLGKATEHAAPTDRGFDVNMGGNDAGGPYAGGYFSPFNNPNLTDKPEEKGMSYAMKLAHETANFMAAHRSEPFFAYLAFYEVHAPIQSTEARWKKYRDKAVHMGVSDKGFDTAHFFPVRRHQDNPVYAGLVEQMDEAVGLVLQKIKDLGIEKNTIVIFTSDNGGVTSGDNYSTSPLHVRGGKGLQWEGGTRVPCIFYIPWLLQVRECKTPISGIDFFPTIMEMTTTSPINTKQKLDGESLLPLMTGKSIKSRPLFWHYPHYSNQGSEPSSTMLSGNWKLIHYWEDNRDELYNLSTDPFEKSNLSATNLSMKNKMHGDLLEWLDKTNARLPAPDPGYTKEAFNEWKQNTNTVKLAELEKYRKEILQSNWKPNDNWWKSKTTVPDN